MSQPAAPLVSVVESDQYRHLLEANHIANTIAVVFRRSVFDGLGGFTKHFSPAEA